MQTPVLVYLHNQVAQTIHRTNKKKATQIISLQLQQLTTHQCMPPFQNSGNLSKGPNFSLYHSTATIVRNWGISKKCLRLQKSPQTSNNQF